MNLATEQQKIVAHFASQMPAVRRALFEAIVLRELKHRGKGDIAQLTTRACIDALTSLDREVFRSGGGYVRKIWPKSL